MVKVENVKNSAAVSLPKKVIQVVKLESIKPNIKLIGKGNIIPRSNGLIFPFEAVNLRAVDVKIIKIYENNIVQFLQVNELSGESELARVGKEVVNKTLDLTKFDIADFSQWNKFSIDLSTLINAEPGAIYNVKLSFKKEYSLYTCDGAKIDLSKPLENIIKDTEEEEEDEYQGWGYYSDEEYYYDEYDDYYYDYDWRERDNPCNSTYYYYKSLTRNILASDLGIIVKRSNDGGMNIFITDLVTAQPLQGITVELYSFEKQLLTTLTTNAEGMATATLKKAPYLLVAKKDKQRGYLRLNNGASLSLSMFDVSGDYVQKGLKGFFYGERGVWRPGDSLYLTFILEDKNKTLPANHPVLFDLLNPQGQIVKHIVKTIGVNGFYSFATCTDVDAPTGNWTARVKVGNVLFTKSLKIETVMPNRLKINLNFGDKVVADKKIRGALNVKWLHGGPARNLKANIQMTLKSSETSFKKYPAHIFTDPTKYFSSESITIFDDQIDENGNAIIEPEFELETQAPGVLHATFQTRVFEEGGAFSIDKISLPYYPYKSFVGLKAPEGNKYTGVVSADVEHAISIVNVDANGNTVSGNKIKIEVYKVEWRWWWDHSRDYLSNYVNNEYNKPIDSKEVTTNGGTYTYKFKVDYPDWGRFLIRVTDLTSNHSTGKIVYVDWPYNYERNRDGQSETVTMLMFNSDKQKYAVGEEVKLKIPSGDGGKALVSVETGTRVLKTFWVNTIKGTTETSFTATADMTPNVFVHVTLLQPHAQTLNDLPIRLYGIVPIGVEDANTHLTPLIQVADVLKPEQNASITVREATGKAMTYTLAVVDEGLLDLTRFETPNPWPVFYAREALGVKTWDLFDYVMGAFGGGLERILSIGGDAEIDRNKANKKANRFKPMVKYLGPFKLEKGASATHTFKMPQYVGSVRVMVVAGENGAYGSAEKTVAVKKPLMLLATLPRVIGPNETFSLPVNIFAMESQVKNVNVKIAVNNVLTIIGENEKAISFNAIGDEIVNFKVKAGNTLGIAKVDIVATSGTEVAKYSVEVDIRNPNAKVVDIIEKVINPGETWSPDVKLVGVAGTNKGTIEVATVIPMNLESRLRYLVTYPHGCLEQTTSAAFPQLFVADLMELSTTMKAEVERNMKVAIAKIVAKQGSEGGLYYWPNSSSYDDWSTSYAGHFMLEAGAKGYSIPNAFLSKWKKYQKRQANDWKHSKTYGRSDLIQAYRLYTLALAKAPELGAMNQLRESKDLSLSARWRLAAAYKIAGFEEVALQLMRNADITIKPYREMSYTYGSDSRDRAMLLETLCMLGMKDKALLVAKDLSRQLSSDYWMSTQSAAYSLMAMSKYIKLMGGTSYINYSYSVNGSAATKINSGQYISQVDMKVKNKSGNVSASITNHGKSAMYARIVLEGNPLVGNSVAKANDLIMDVSFETTDGKTIDPSKLEQGKDFIAVVVVKHPGVRGYYNEMALSMVFPSGWEILNERMMQIDGMGNSVYSYKDIRDDRVNIYFDISPSSTKVFRVKLNAAYAGEFYLPGFSCEAMYDATVNAQSVGKWVSVVSVK